MEQIKNFLKTVCYSLIILILGWIFFLMVSNGQVVVNLPQVPTVTQLELPALAPTSDIIVIDDKPERLLAVEPVVTNPPVATATRIVPTATPTPKPADVFASMLFTPVPAAENYIIFPLRYSLLQLRGCLDVAQQSPAILSPDCHTFIQSEQQRCADGFENYGLCEALP